MSIVTETILITLCLFLGWPMVGYIGALAGKYLWDPAPFRIDSSRDARIATGLGPIGLALIIGGGIRTLINNLKIFDHFDH